MIIRRLVDQHVVGADVGERLLAALKERKHPIRIRDAVIRGD